MASFISRNALAFVVPTILALLSAYWFRKKRKLKKSGEATLEKEQNANTTEIVNKQQVCFLNVSPTDEVTTRVTNTENEACATETYAACAESQCRTADSCSQEKPVCEQNSVSGFLEEQRDVENQPLETVSNHISLKEEGLSDGAYEFKVFKENQSEDALLSANVAKSPELELATHREHEHVVVQEASLEDAFAGDEAGAKEKKNEACRDPLESEEMNSKHLGVAMQFSTSSCIDTSSETVITYAEQEVPSSNITSKNSPTYSGSPLSNNNDVSDCEAVSSVGTSSVSLNELISVSPVDLTKETVLNFHGDSFADEEMCNDSGKGSTLNLDPASSCSYVSELDDSVAVKDRDDNSCVTDKDRDDSSCVTDKDRDDSSCVTDKDRDDSSRVIDKDRDDNCVADKVPDDTSCVRAKIPEDTSCVRAKDHGFSCVTAKNRDGFSYSSETNANGFCEERVVPAEQSTSISKHFFPGKELNHHNCTQAEDKSNRAQIQESSTSNKCNDVPVQTLETKFYEHTSSPYIYEFELPQELCGRLIGRQGKHVNFIKERTNASVFIKRHPFNPQLKLAVVEGTREEVNNALELIRKKYPPSAFPSVTLAQTNATVSALGVAVPESLQLHLPERTSCDVILSSMVNASHFFLQQPTHPTYSSLSTLDQYMMACYTQGETPHLPQTIEAGIICAATVMGGWYRAQVMFIHENGEDCEVKFVDYGGYSQVSASSLRQIRSDFMSLPFQASECYLANVQPINEFGWTPEASATFEELAQGQILQAIVVDYHEDGIPYVHLYRVQGISSTFINEELANRGVAKWVEHR